MKQINAAARFFTNKILNTPVTMETYAWFKNPSSNDHSKLFSEASLFQKNGPQNSS